MDSCKEFLESRNKDEEKAANSADKNEDPKDKIAKNLMETVEMNPDYLDFRPLSELTKYEEEQAKADTKGSLKQSLLRTKSEGGRLMVPPPLNTTTWKKGTETKEETEKQQKTTSM